MKACASGGHLTSIDNCHTLRYVNSPWPDTHIIILPMMNHRHLHITILYAGPQFKTTFTTTKKYKCLQLTKIFLLCSLQQPSSFHRLTICACKIKLPSNEKRVNVTHSSVR